MIATLIRLGILTAGCIFSYKVGTAVGKWKTIDPFYAELASLRKEQLEVSIELGNEPTDTEFTILTERSIALEEKIKKLEEMVLIALS